MKPKDGDFIVITSGWSHHRFEVRQVIRLTDQMYYYESEWCGKKKQQRARLDEIIFSSPDEEAANLLSERLKSSRALMEEENRKSYARRESRDRELIEAATTALSVTEEK
jgi:hypothetical protein